MENDFREREIEFWSRVVAEEGKMRTHTKAEIQPVGQLLRMLRQTKAYTLK